MDENSELDVFAKNLQQDVIARADSVEEGALRPDTFTEITMGYLADAGEIDDAVPCAYEATGMRCSGYSLSEDNDRLDLFLSIPRPSGEASRIATSEIDTAIRRLTAYFKKAIEKGHKGMEEAHDSYDMTRSIWQARSEISHVRLFILTDAVANVERLDNETFGEIEISRHVWDLRRIYRATSSGGSHEPVCVDFANICPTPIRSIVVSPEGGGYRCLMAFMPGELIVQLYKEFGPRLLERNVRSFLQLKGKVNQAIRKTILEEPQMFLAFNNGLSVTASGLTLRDHGDGTADLLHAKDFQIVNGGQTTGSIFRASLKDKSKFDASRLKVQVKITEILAEGDVDDIAPRISQSANNQNKVNLTDFSSNHAFHRKIEELSRSIWAPPMRGMQKQTHWFYERARGQYHDALSKAQTPAQQKIFESVNPRRQMIEKIDLAKFEHTWSQLPHIVSRGAQKCYLHFMDTIDQRGAFVPDEEYFKRMVALGILFKETERIVSRQKLGGYRANIVTYTLAWLSNHTAKRVDLDSIWNAQSLSPIMCSTIEAVSLFAHEHIVNPPGGQDVKEWCKKEACWEKFSDRTLAVPGQLETELISRERQERGEIRHSPDEQISPAESEAIARISAIPSETWFSIAAWAKDTRTLLPWQRSLAYSLGRNASIGKLASRKQAVQGEKILTEARSLGFNG